MSKDQKGFIVYGNHEEILDRLTDEEAGKLLKAMTKYFNHGTEPKFDGALEFVWIPIRQQMDANAEKYEAKCQKNKESIQRYWNKVKGDTNEYERIRTNTNATNIDIDMGINKNIEVDVNMESVPDAGLLSFDLIQYLNEKTGSDYKADKANAVRVQSLLDSGYTPLQLRTVIDKKVDEWYGDSKMRSYLRPSTLFGDKFGEYLAAPISIAVERERDQKKKQSGLNRELEEKRQALSVMKESLKEATKEERRHLRENIAILEDSIGLIERRLI